MTEKPELSDGHGRIANEIMEVLASTYMSSYESQFIWCLFRKTYGWHKKEDHISLSQIAAATGMQLSHVSRTKKKLLHRRIVTQTGNKIAFNKYHSQWMRLPKQVMLPKQATKRPPAHSGKTPPPKQVFTPPPKQAYTKDILTKDTSTKDSGAKNAPTPSQQAVLFFTDETVQQKAIEFFTSKGAGAEEVRRELTKFISYWTEPNKSGTKVRWQLQSTFDVKRRLVTWLNNAVKYDRSGSFSTPEI